MSDTPMSAEKAWTQGQVRETFVRGREQHADFTGINNSRAEFERWLATHDQEVLVEYEGRRKPEPIHIDNIDGQNAAEWLATHDAEVRAAALKEAQEAIEDAGVWEIDQIQALRDADLG
jgi:hypothetical protein